MTRGLSPDSVRYPPSPDELFTGLFEIVQMRHLFADGKTFADMEPRQSPAQIMAAWHARADQDDRDDGDVRAFVSQHFSAPLQPHLDPPEKRGPMADYIAGLWDSLVISPTAHGPYSSALSLPHAYVIPGGRFREIYYWDSYFTMLGLAVDGHQALVEHMLDNFVSLIERYGHVPNGTRSYFLSRSQPPFLALMTELSTDDAPAVRERRLHALLREHAYWMQGDQELAPYTAQAHAVRVSPDAVLNRYWDARMTPRPEAYAEDVALAARSDRPAGEVYRDLRAACESGWDFSSRWLRDPQDLATVQTTSIIPVDLNCLLYMSERRIAAESLALGDTETAQRFGAAAERRAAAIDQLCWIESEGRFADWQWVDRAPLPHATAATLYPLFAGIATPAQAAAVAALVEARLLAPGGLRTTTLTSGQQWDVPNGWAPLQWIAITGLRRYGHDALADTIAERWLATVAQVYDATGTLLEKYDVELGRPGGGGEYPNQEGFGWTNGVTQALLSRRP